MAGILVLAALGAIFGSDDDEGADQASTTSSPSVSEPADEAESSTPETSSPAPVPRTPEQTLRAAILKEIGDLNREGPKWLSVKAIGEPRTPIQVTFACNENLTEGLTKDSLRIDATDILKVIQDKADWRYNQVIIVGTYLLVDKLGNSEEEQVVRANNARAPVDQINFEGFSFKDVFDVADDAFVHPAFQE